jgi:hypothetical protein
MIMDSHEIERLRRIATDAQVNHWPPHLGLNTDAERVEFLAKALSDVLDQLDDWQSVIDKVSELGDVAEQAGVLA